MTDLAGALARHPRVSLTRLPTPIQALPALSERLGLDVWIKRDDLTDLALGGDKARKLEFELAVARAAGTDTLVTCGSSQSNHARLTTAAARQLGMACTVVLSDDEWRAVQGNLLTVHLMGADVVMVETEDHWDLEDRAHEICAEIERRGGRAHYIPVSGTTPTSCLGYVAAGLEISEQITELGLAPDAVFTPFGTGGVFTALMLAFRHAGLDCPMVGVSVNRDTETCRANIDHWWSALHDLLEIETDADRGPHEVTDEFLGAEYGDPTPACLDAIVAFAETEGVLLDPVYTGKMGAGFLDRASRGRLPPGSTVLLVHTGGVPALFAYHRVIEDHLRRRGGA